MSETFEQMVERIARAYEQEAILPGTTFLETSRELGKRLRDELAKGQDAIGEVERYTGNGIDFCAPFDRVVFYSGIQPPVGTKLYTCPFIAAPAGVPDGEKR